MCIFVYVLFVLFSVLFRHIFTYSKTLKNCPIFATYLHIHIYIFSVLFSLFKQIYLFTYFLYFFTLLSNWLYITIKYTISVLLINTYRPTFHTKRLYKNVVKCCILTKYVVSL